MSPKKFCVVLAFVIALITSLGCGVENGGSYGERAVAAPKSVPVVNSPSEVMPAIIAYAQVLDNNHWLVGDFDRLWRTDDGGKSWKLSHPIKSDSTRKNHIGGLTFVDDKTGFLMVDKRGAANK